MTTGLAHQPTAFLEEYVGAVSVWASAFFELFISPASFRTEDEDLQRAFGFAPSSRTEDTFAEGTAQDYHLADKSPLRPYATSTEQLDSLAVTAAAKSFALTRVAIVLGNMHQDLFPSKTFRSPCVEWSETSTCTSGRCDRLHVPDLKSSLMQQLPVVSSIAKLMSSLEMLWRTGARETDYGDAKRLRR